MSRTPNDLAGLPAHVQAVFFREFAREAELMAHKAHSQEIKIRYGRLAQMWLSCADELDQNSGPCAVGQKYAVALH
jgi:hypothetical protein